MGKRLEFEKLTVGEIPNEANEGNLAKALAVNFKGKGTRWIWLAKWDPVLDLFWQAYEAEKHNQGDLIAKFLETAMLVIRSEIYRLIEPPTQALSLLEQLTQEIAKGQKREQWNLSIPLKFNKEKLQGFLENA